MTAEGTVWLWSCGSCDKGGTAHTEDRAHKAGDKHRHKRHNGEGSFRWWEEGVQDD